MKRFIVLLALGFGWVPAAYGWWDTQVRAQKPLPLVKEFEAEECKATVGAEVRQDTQADGGRGGRVVYLKPGAALVFTANLKRSVYCVWAIARADEKEFAPPKEREQELELPGGKVKIPYARQPVFATLTVTRPDGRVESSVMPITYRTDYAVVSRMYFVLHVEGRCEVRFGLDARSEIGLLVDRLELRDALGNCARKAAKTSRMLTSDQELVRIRTEFAQKQAGHRPRWLLIAPRTPEERRARNDQLWETAPPLNLLTADPMFDRWQRVTGNPGLSPNGFLGCADCYEATGNEDIAMDGAVLLCAFAEKYPGIDHYVAETGGYSQLASPNPLYWGSRDGKTVYSGWEGPNLERYATAYDKLFDFIRSSQALADYVHTRVPWVKTPRDVIELIDTNLLQHGMDCLNRRVIRSDEASAFVPLVQGVNDVSRRMLADGLFSKMHYNMADAGGIDDQAFTSFSRGGVHYIGATGYVGPALTHIADILKKYVDAGGDRRFALDPERYPHMAEAEKTRQALYCAGGFTTVVGDSMDMRRNRTPNIPEFPSRVVEGFGEAILEDGQGQPNALLKRAVHVHTGIGRGHAHQDMLTLEMFAHSTRLAPDLGGRREGGNYSIPDMRHNRMHNLVEVDERNFHNVYPGSTTSGTGWTTAFSPQPGAQYMANAARATSHPHVRLYHRATVMIDGPITERGADIYVFDVFRVAGGRVHTYCFHGTMTEGEKLEANVPLAPATSEIARKYMQGRPEASQVEGRATDPLVVTWRMDPALQKHYQAEFHQPDRPVSLTLSLFGQDGAHVMVGSATSPVYPVAMPYLHVQTRQEEEGLVSIYPALYEAHAGAPFITGKHRMKVTPESREAESAVALVVMVGDQRQDTLFHSLKPAILHTLEDGTRVAGEFAFVSEDADGLRLLHLVGGTQLLRGDVAVRCEKPAHEARVEAVDYPRHRLTLSADMPALLLDGQVALLGNERHWTEFQLGQVGGRTAAVVRTPRYYQSPITFVESEKRLVATELEPMVYGADTKHCDGTTVTNEAHTKFWRATLEPRERWMYLGWPGTRLSYPTEVTWKDLPDADGDGRRTLRLIGNKGDKDKDGNSLEGKVLLELEVTRVEPRENLFYFKMPDNPDYQHGGWQYAHRLLVNEDGTKKWWASYPGTSFAWILEGDEPVRDADFADTDKDGRRKLFAYHFGPGDTFRVNAFVHVSRRERGLYQVRANVPCALTLPGTGPVEISPDGQTFRPLASKAVGKSVEVALTAADLGAGTVFIRLGR